MSQDNREQGAVQQGQGAGPGQAQGPVPPGTPRRRWPRRVRVMLVLMAVTLLVGGGMFALQRQLVFFPDATAPGRAASAVPGAEDVRLTTSDGLELTAWFVPPDPETDRELVVLYAPGNGGNRASRAGVASELSDRGFGVLLLDYRGYGGNPGSPSEEGLAADALAAAEELEARGHRPEQTIYVGESLGTGVVARLLATREAAGRSPAGVLLRSPFPDLAEVGAHHYPWLPVRTLLRDRFEVTEHLRSSQVPVSVVHGDADSVVPSRLSAQVAAAVPHLVEELVLAGVDHNDPVMFGAPVADAVARLADAL
ncbi:alpha/beta hydrolase [Nocardioides sp.]|uniref:alpha/beta hydrolase n=1 Tax=Nocardioides sp. TaxID=35761 RepID=UPI0027364AD5|nr:alpha/beta hydrolase [Nocardioides sp.]MDP3890204.1 alpha/beta hydrolase [Nocardioides sp.]